MYDPSKLDVGPETEAILDQLKGREYQTRIVLNKADQVHPEELLRVQGALIWNISPLMSSQQPPIMYTVSLWSNPFEENTPIRLLQAQEKALLQDLAQAIEHRIENKIASARRFAVIFYYMYIPAYLLNLKCQENDESQLIPNRFVFVIMQKWLTVI